MGPNKTFWHLEERIWDTIKTKAYGGKEEEADSLKERLAFYLLEPEDSQTITQRGLEELSTDADLVRSVNIVANDRLFGYIRAIERVLGKTDLNEKGLVDIYTIKDTSFLKREAREKRDEVMRYGALLHILDRSNTTVKEVTDFVKDVHTLFAIYHNINVEHGVFASDVNYQSYTNVIQAIEQNRRDITLAKSFFSKGLAAYVLSQSYRIESAILFQFVNSLRISDIESQGVDLSKLELKRFELRQKLESTGKLNSLGHEAKEFYLGSRIVNDYIRRA